jgi:integrase/recombinase XerD
MHETCRFKPSTISRRFSVAAGFYRTCVIDGILEHSPAEHVRRPNVPAESPTLGFTHLQFEALLTAARESDSNYDFALVAMLGLLGLRIFEATGADIADLGEEHGHRVLRVCGKGTKIVLVPLPPAVGRAIDRATAGRASGPILLNSRGARMDRHAATRRLRHLAQHAGVRITRAHPHMLRHTFVTTMLDAGVDLRDVQIAARHADPRTTTRYDVSRELHQPGEKPQVTRSRRYRNNVPAFAQRPSGQARLRSDPFWCKIHPPEGRGAQWALLRAHRGREGVVAAGLQGPGSHSDSCDT